MKTDQTSGGTVAPSAYDHWHAGHVVDEESDAPWHRELKRLLPPLAGMRVMEMACGRGGFAAWLGTLPDSRRPNELVACDVSPVAVRMAAGFGKERGVRSVSYQVADALELPFAGGSFDAVISCETIEHVPDPPRALAEFQRVLKPEGRLFLTCPNYANLMGLHRRYREWTGRPYTEEGQPINHPLSLRRVRSWLGDAGFRIERCGGVGHYLPFPGRPPLRAGFLDRFPWIWRWAYHSLVSACKSGT